ncbi:MAG: WecB/TagA/CpsF family glycosyltransferase [Lachnospiraceae bacterium]
MEGKTRREKVLGVSVDSLRLDRAMSLTKAYLNNALLNKIYFASTQTSILAQDEEEIAQFVESLDLILPGDKNIEEAMNGKEKINEELPYVLHYLYQLFARFDRKKNSIYIVGKEEERVELLMEMLKESYPNMKISGGVSEADKEILVNDINTVVPDAVLLFFPIRELKQFLDEHGRSMNAKLAICVEDIDILIDGRIEKIPVIIEKLHLEGIYQFFLRNKIISPTIQDSIFKKRLKEENQKKKEKSEN